MHRVTGSSIILTLACLSVVAVSSATHAQGPAGEFVRRPAAEFIRRPPNPSTSEQTTQRHLGKTTPKLNRSSAQSRSGRKKQSPAVSIGLGGEPPADWIARAEVELRDANAARERKEYAKAQTHYTSAMVLNPNDPRIHYGLGNVLYDQEKIAAAEQSYKEAIRLKSDYVDALLALAGSYASYAGPNPPQGSRYDAARELYRRVAQLKPDSADAFFGWCATYFDEGYFQAKSVKQALFPKAIEKCQQAVRLDSNHSRAYKIMGDAHLMLEQYGQAITAYENAIRIDPNYKAPLSDLASLYSTEFRYAEAIELYKRLLRLHPDDEVERARLGWAYLNAGRYGEAIEQFNELIRRLPDSYRGYWGLGMTYVKLKNSRAAREQYQLLRQRNEYIAADLLKEIEKLELNSPN